MGEERREFIKGVQCQPRPTFVENFDCDRCGTGRDKPSKINLRNYCADLFHFDVPWNPSRMEQRNGRIDRKLQRESEVRCHYFVLSQRVEDRVLDVLVRKTKQANEAERTAQSYEEWRSDAITQMASAWVLSGVFVRFLEDNQLIDPPLIAGLGERLQRARDEHELYFRQHPQDTDRDYWLMVFDRLAKLPGAREIFGANNRIRELPNWLSGDAAGELLRFFQRVEPGTGRLVHDFTDENWDTRFLGDLYQDLSEAARKKYALLQTPEFVESFILDRTLEPALDEFQLEFQRQEFRMIDPACGSGHFLLGSFHQLLDRWIKKEPATAVGNIGELVLRSLSSIHGVDINPYAVAIARFRLLLAAMKASGIERLQDAPAFPIQVVCGDSLLHGEGNQLLLGDWAPMAHYFHSEDIAELSRILVPGTYHTRCATISNGPHPNPFSS